MQNFGGLRTYIIGAILFESVYATKFFFSIFKGPKIRRYQKDIFYAIMKIVVEIQNLIMDVKFRTISNMEKIL